METVFVYKDEVSHRFWRITRSGLSYIVMYGKEGSVGMVKTKTFETEEDCDDEVKRLIQLKLKKGYQPASSVGLMIKETTLTEELFWELLEKARTTGEDPEDGLEWLVNYLSTKSIKDIVKFDYHFHEYYMKSYTSDLWAAAYIIMGGCSDDCFDYFRAWLLFQGKKVYESAIENPETLIPYLKRLGEQGEVPQLEEILFAACEAYEKKTGNDDEDYLAIYEKLTKDPFIQLELDLDWDEDNEESLKAMFPGLWELYGESPLE